MISSPFLRPAFCGPQKFRSDIEQLDRDHLQKLREQAAESQQTAVAAQLARAREGSQEEFVLKAQAIQAELQAAIAAIDTRQSKEQQAAQQDRLRAEATRQQADLEFQMSLASLDTYLSQERTRVNAQYAVGQLTKAQHEAALAAIERAGTASRIVVQQDYNRDATAEQETQSQQTVQALEQELARKEAIAEQEQQLRLAVASTAADAADLIIQAFGEETEAGQAALAIKKTAALAEIAINLAIELSNIGKNAAANPLNIPTAGLAGLSQATILSGIAIAKAAFATARVLAFADGGVLQGRSHAQGGIPFTVAGRPGFEAEGDEIILTKGVHRNPVLRPFASLLNMLGGGKPLYQDPMPASLMARYAEGGVVRFDPAWMPAMTGRTGGTTIDYQELARAVAQELGPVFYAANKALPAPVTVLSELKEKQDKVARNEKRADL